MVSCTPTPINTSFNQLPTPMPYSTCSALHTDPHPFRDGRCNGSIHISVPVRSVPGLRASSGPEERAAWIVSQAGCGEAGGSSSTLDSMSCRALMSALVSSLMGEAWSPLRELEGLGEACCCCGERIPGVGGPPADAPSDNPP